MSRKTWENEKSSSETLNLYIIQYRRQKRRKYAVMEDMNMSFLDGTTVHAIFNPTAVELVKEDDQRQDSHS